MAKRTNTPDDDSSKTSADLNDDAPGATAFVRLDAAPPPDDAPGATAFVRIDQGGALPPPRRANPGSTAPKKGLQVQLPDDEPAPAPKPKPKIAPAAPQGKGRRGAWWDEQHPGSGDDEPSQNAPAEEAPAEEAPADDAPGSTAFLKVDDAPPPPKRRAPERRAPEPAPAEAPPADDGRTQFFKPDQVVLAGDARERPAPAQPPEPSIPWKPLVLVLVVAFIVSAISLVLIYRKDVFRPTPKHPVQATDNE